MTNLIIVVDLNFQCEMCIPTGVTQGHLLVCKILRYWNLAFFLTCNLYGLKHIKLLLKTVAITQTWLFCG